MCKVAPTFLNPVQEAISGELAPSSSQETYKSHDFSNLKLLVFNILPFNEIK